PWQLKPQPEKVDGQTVVIAKLDGRGEFRIFCDRFEMAPDGAKAFAIGRVTFYSPPFAVSCKRLTLPLAEPLVVFEDQVNISPPGIGGLRIDRAVWDFPLIVPPAGVPGALGAPK